MTPLQGRANYHDWAIAMKAYLQHEDVWQAVEAPLNGAITTNEKTLAKARSKIILGLDPVVYSHFSDSDTAELIWKKLKAAFDDVINDFADKTTNNFFV